MIERTEQEIMRYWKGNPTTPLVSICTITYNHENYIVEALESFLMQETDFAFEIVIDDDCSPDGTARIIEKYRNKYPNIINVNIREKNVGMMINITENMKRAKGEYLALCEGDDYWTDPQKLQIQIDEMRKYPSHNISFHPVHEFIDNKIGRIIAHYSEENKTFTTSEVIVNGGTFMPTASLVVKKGAVEDLINTFLRDAPVGDFFIQVVGSLKGGALYINKCMGIYRRGHIESWASEEKDFQKIKKWRKKYLSAMQKLDKETGYRYYKDIYKYLIEINYRVLRAKSVPLGYKINIFYNIKSSLSLSRKIYWYAVLSKPNIHSFLKVMKSKISF